MHFRISRFPTGINDWLRYYVITVERNGKYLRKDGTIQDTTGLATYSIVDTPDSGNFPTIQDAIKAIESVGGTYKPSDSIRQDILERIQNLSDDKFLKLLVEIEKLCGPL